MITIGALLLMLPIATNPGHRISLLDALFEATSAVCVTGLVVADTATTFTMFGELVLMGLIQIGGLGFMTIGILVAVLLGRKIGLSERMLAQSALNQFSLSGVVQLVKTIVLMTLVIEGTGALLLASAWADDMGWGVALYYGLFHAVSAFNNAGFDLSGNFSSLTGYVGDVPVNLVITTLFILGGLGFTVIMDVLGKRGVRAWSLNTKAVLLMTLALNVAASLLIFFAERDNPGTLGGLSTGEQLLASYFHGTVPRTAGFNTLDMTALSSDSLLLTIALMFIGGASGSTAGGIKVTTFLLLLLVVKSFLSRSDDITLLKKRIPIDLVFRALAISMIGMLLIFVAVFLLEMTEPGVPIVSLAFEAVSAFGTVGLSLGVTPELSTGGKLIIMILMFVGRLGPLTIAFAFTVKGTKRKFRYPEEKILIG